MSDSIDPIILKELSLIMGDDLPQLITTFFSDCEIKIAQLDGLLNQGDSESIRRVVHSIKGSSHNLGAVLLTKNCEVLESAARQQNLSNAKAQLSDIVSSYTQVKMEFHTLYF